MVHIKRFLGSIGGSVRGWRPARSTLAFAAVPALVLAAGCERAERTSDSPPASAADTTSALPAGATDSVAPLIVIMQRIERDVQDLHHGAWTRDLELVAASARSIANHAKVPAGERKAIASILGEEFCDFAALDREVHDRATTLADSAPAWSPERVLERWEPVAGACLACHARFRERLVEAGYSER